MSKTIIVVGGGVIGVEYTSMFAALGILNGVWAARIPAVKAGLGLSDGALGLALIAAPVGLVLATLAAGRIVDRFGSSRPARVAGALVVVVPVGMGLARNQAELMAALLAYGAVGGTLDVAMNLQAIAVDKTDAARNSTT